MGGEPPKPVSQSELIFEAPVKSSDEPISTGSMFHLSKDQLESYRNKALRGDVHSAVRLYEFFTFSESNASERVFWMRKASELGSPVVQYSFALYLEKQGEMDEAIKWAEASGSQGNEKSKALALELRSKYGD